MCLCICMCMGVWVHVIVYVCFGCATCMSTTIGVSNHATNALQTNTHTHTCPECRQTTTTKTKPDDSSALLLGRVGGYMVRWRQAKQHCSQHPTKATTTTYVQQTA